VTIEIYKLGGIYVILFYGKDGKQILADKEGPSRAPDKR
jgi:hypothetical protein